MSGTIQDSHIDGIAWGLLVASVMNFTCVIIVVRRAASDLLGETELRCILLLDAFAFQFAEGVLLYLLEREGVPLDVAVIFFAAPAALSAVLLCVAHRSLRATTTNFLVEGMFAYLAVAYVVEQSIASWFIFMGLALNEAVIATVVYFVYDDRKAGLTETIGKLFGAIMMCFHALGQIVICCLCWPCDLYEKFRISTRVQEVSEADRMPRPASPPGMQGIGSPPVPMTPRAMRIATGLETVFVEETISNIMPTCVIVLAPDVLSNGGASHREEGTFVTFCRDLIAKGLGEVLQSVLTPLFLRFMYEQSLARSPIAPVLYIVGPFLSGVFFKMRYKEPFERIPIFRAVGSALLILDNAFWCGFWMATLVKTVVDVGWRPFDVVYAIFGIAFSALCILPANLDRIVRYITGSSVEESQMPVRR